VTTLVCFTAAGTRYAIPVTSTLSVRPASTVVHVPSDRADMVGVLPGDPVLSVISPLGVGAGASHVLVVTTPERDYGLLVDAVTDVCTVDDAAIRPAPDHGVVIAVAERPDGVLLIADPTAMGAQS
jgi:purine-binding chemotaxis protein CheW